MKKKQSHAKAFKTHTFQEKAKGNLKSERKAEKKER